MEIILPKSIHNDQEVKLINPRVITIIGANGAGKTRFARAIETRYHGEVFAISAARAISISLNDKALHDENSISSLYEAAFPDESPLKTGYAKVLALLRHQPRLCESVMHGWSKVFPGTTLRCSQQGIEVVSPHGEIYDEEDMSQGEKIVLYHLAGSQLAAPRSIVIAEDPEIFLNRSVLSLLWDTVETYRRDCTFIYLTHDIDFTLSRIGGIRLWVKNYDNRQCAWDYERISTPFELPEEVYLELLGGRKPILFIEGSEQSSIDVRLYPHIFPHYTVKPLGGCNRVIETTRAFGTMKEWHHLDSKGIVDRDRRTDNEIAYLRQRNIFVPEVAEVENILLLEEVVAAIARLHRRDPQHAVRAVKGNVIDAFLHQLKEQALQHTRHQISREITFSIDRRINTIDQLARHVATLTQNIDVYQRYHSICGEFEHYAHSYDYASVLRVFNQKSMLSFSQVATLCGVENKDKYIESIIYTLKQDTPIAQELRHAIQRIFKLDNE